jgi:hypothetical protein
MVTAVLTKYEATPAAAAAVDGDAVHEHLCRLGQEGEGTCIKYTQHVHTSNVGVVHTHAPDVGKV